MKMLNLTKTTAKMPMKKKTITTTAQHKTTENEMRRRKSGQRKKVEAKNSNDSDEVIIAHDLLHKCISFLYLSLFDAIFMPRLTD